MGLGEWSCRRRYSDFHELRNKMVENWPGIFIPGLPEKKKMGNLEEKFVKERQECLDNFCKEIALRPYLYHSEEFQLFIRNPGDKTAKLLESMRILTIT